MTKLSTFVEIRPRTAARRAASRARRADRTPSLLGLKRDANAELDHLVALILGVGGVGATAALSLAHLSVGELRLVDRGCFKTESLATQPITPKEIGRPKASAIARLCKEISPRTRVLAFDGPLQQLPLPDMTGARVVIVAGDNLTVLHEAGQRCQRLGLPLIHAAVHGETLTAQCRTYGNATAHAPCPVCLFEAEEFRLMDEERAFSCEGARDPGARADGRSLRPTMSLRPLCALAGEMAALQAVRLALGIGTAVCDTLLEVCAYTWRSHVTPIARNPKCPCPHERYKLRSAPRTLDACSPGELLRAAGLRGSPADSASFAAEGFRWVERGLCGCAESQPVHRFVHNGDALARHCAKCGRPIAPQPFYSHDAIPFGLLAPFRDRSLRSLGAVGCRGVLVCRREDTVLLTNTQRKARP
jgi:adenylyltransferase/sulfurtransferase